jgi:hypothetical protein
MYNTRHNLIIGFHGCDESVRDKIVSGQEMLYESRNLWDWLGYGYYFWENNYTRAFDWAVELETRGNVTKPAVLGAMLYLGNCLDLSDTEFIVQLQTGYESLKQTSTVMPENKNQYLRNLDCAVIETIHEMRAKNNLAAYDSVRSGFPEGKAVYPTAGFHDKNHIQICIRNPNCIKGFFIPRNDHPEFQAV